MNEPIHVTCMLHGIVDHDCVMCPVCFKEVHPRDAAKTADGHFTDVHAGDCQREAGWP